MTSPFGIRGIAEAHTGAPWSWVARERLIRYIGELGFNLYLYAPGDDPLLRDRWWEPYLREEVEALADLAGVGSRRGVRLCVALDPGEPRADLVLRKWLPLYRAGFRSFALLSHAGLASELLAKLPGVELFTPDASDLPPAVEVFWPVLGESVSAADMERAGRKILRPPVLWDRYPANPGPLRESLPLRPIRGRDPNLAEVVSGVIAECGAQPEACRVALHTWAAYLRDPAEYDPERAWVQALAHVGAEAAPALRLLGELTRRHDLEPPAVIDDLPGRFEAWARAAAILKELPDRPLRDDLRPWVAKLALSADAGLKSVAMLAAEGEAARDRLRGQVLSALWRLREQPAWVLGDQVERFVRDALRQVSGD